MCVMLSLADMKLADAINPKGIFANNLLRLEEVDVYGFDYDYTLALYKKTLDRLIYDLGVKSLVEVGIVFCLVFW